MQTMRTPFEVREAEQSDIAALIVLFGALDDLHTAGVPYQFQGSSAVLRTEQSMVALLQNPDAAVLVAAVGSRVVGQAVVEIREAPDRVPFVPRKYAQVHDLVVANDMRRQGIGRALMHAAERWAGERGADSVEIGVWEFNEHALSFYEELGYLTQFRKLRRALP
jgi:diamine N-acetyltransferase